MKKISKIFISLIFISSYWWGFKIIELYRFKYEINQIITTLFFSLFSLALTIIGFIILAKTLIRIFKITDKS